MIEVNEALAKKGLTVEDLPLSLQKEVSKLESMCDKFNTAWNEYEDSDVKDEKTEERFDKIESNIEVDDNLLAEKILDFNPNAEAEAAAAKATAEAEAAAAKAAAESESAAAKKKSNGSGWGIFFAITAAALLAVVGIKNAKK